MKPINDQMANYGKSNGTGKRGPSNNPNQPGGGKSINLLGIIILVIMIFIYIKYSDVEPVEMPNEPFEQEQSNVYGSSNYNNEAYDYSRPSDYANQESLDLFSLLFGGSTGNSVVGGQDNISYSNEAIKNSSSDTYTLMIYMCGSNLESDGGYASSDLEEMLKSQLAEEVNVLVYTGGAKRWYDYGISNKTNQIYKIESHRLKLIKDNVGQKSMTESATLLEFLNYGKTNYKADKYALIFWDHGGGAVSGFGLDEAFARKNDNLTIDEIKKALDGFGEKLEFVGFDACLMANFETAYAIKDNANYLIASEETEPGTGWDYIKVLNGLSKDSSQVGSTTGRTIVDSFIASNSSYRNPDATLSVVDLKKIEDVYQKVVSFLKDVKSSEFDKKNYTSFARAVQNTKAFGDGALDSFDLIDFASQVNTSSSNAVINSVKGAVVYNKTNQYVQNSNGLSIFIPNKKLSYLSVMLPIYKNIGIGSDYTNVLNQYASVKAGGQKPTYEVNNHTYTQSTTDYSVFDWFSNTIISGMRSYYDQTSINPKELEVIDKEDYYALHLTKEDKESIIKTEIVLWYDDGKGYIDMGVDSYHEYDEDGDLKVTSDGTWLAINGDNVVYEPIESTDNYEKGLIPAVVNDERVNIIVYFDKQNPDGVILGYQPDYDEEEVVVFEKGLRKFRIGDKIDFVAKYYKYNGDLEDEHYINDSLIIDKDPLKVSYESLGDGKCLIYYRLTDMYDNVYYTEPIELE